MDRNKALKISLILLAIGVPIALVGLGFFGYGAIQALMMW